MGNENRYKEVRVFSSGRETTLLLLDGTIISKGTANPLMLMEKVSLQETRKAYQAVRSVSLRVGSNPFFSLEEA